LVSIEVLSKLNVPLIYRIQRKFIKFDVLLRDCKVESYRVRAMKSELSNFQSEGYIIFIPKPSRDAYELAKSFRPMSLTSFFLKTMELVDSYIRPGGTVKILSAYGIAVCIPERQIP
jgi:hypothetical protein